MTRSVQELASEKQLPRSAPFLRQGKRDDIRAFLLQLVPRFLPQHRWRTEVCRYIINTKCGEPALLILLGVGAGLDFAGGGLGLGAYLRGHTVGVADEALDVG